MAEEHYINLRYYQKSKCFLYPILGYKSDETYRPSSYLFFQDHSILRGELTVFYRHTKESLFEVFENNRIVNHPLLRGCYQAAEGTIYIYDISGYADDIELFLRGEYSKLSKSLKKTILRYFKDDIEPMSPRPDRFIHTVLFPEIYYTLVAKELGVSIKSLTELGSLYDMEKETLELEEFRNCGNEATTENTSPT